MYEEERIKKIKELEQENAALRKNIGEIWQMDYDAPELNLSNYSQDEVEKVNNAVIEIYNFVDEIS